MFEFGDDASQSSKTTAKCYSKQLTIVWGDYKTEILQVTSSSDVAVSLMYIHPGSNAEVDFLFGPGGDRKRYKRRRGERGPTRNQFATIGEL